MGKTTLHLVRVSNPSFHFHFHFLQIQTRSLSTLLTSNGTITEQSQNIARTRLPQSQHSKPLPPRPLPHTPRRTTMRHPSLNLPLPLPPHTPNRLSPPPNPLHLPPLLPDLRLRRPQDNRPPLPPRNLRPPLRHRFRPSNPSHRIQHRPLRRNHRPIPRRGGLELQDGEMVACILCHRATSAGRKNLAP
jgi:hypothetical protein